LGIPLAPGTVGARCARNKSAMNRADDRDYAAELARRIETSLIDPTSDDEAGRPPSDQPPAFVKALMDDPTPPPERAANLQPADWELIARALRLYATAAS
jgi:hypothetical protein